MTTFLKIHLASSGLSANIIFCHNRQKEMLDVRLIRIGTMYLLKYLVFDISLKTAEIEAQDLLFEFDRFFHLCTLKSLGLLDSFS